MDYPDLSNLPAELKKIIADKRDANVYKMLMHSPNGAPGFTALADALMWSRTWPATWRELAIIRVGHHYKSHYEVHQHEQIGRMVGVSEQKLAACALDADQSALSNEEQIILRLADSIVCDHTLSPAALEEGLELLKPNGLADFVLTVGFYQLVSNFLNVFDVQLEDHDLFAGAAIPVVVEAGA